MNCASNPLQKRIFTRKQLWRAALSMGLLVVLGILYSFSTLFLSHVSAASTVRARQSFTMSPTAGPVGTVIEVSGTGLVYPDGTQINLGYYTIGSTQCVLANQSQSSPVQNQMFSGWMRWPSTTGAGNNFGVCVSVVGHTSFAVGRFDVLSAAPAQVTVSPSVPSASHQITITGSNFLPGGLTVNLVWQAATSGQTLSLGAVTSDNTGAFTQSFTIPAATSTGSYSVTATVGTQQPPTLSASLTFHVIGISVAPASTPGTQPDPTASAVTATPQPTATISTAPALPGSSSIPGAHNESGLLLLLIIGGSLVILLALIGGIVLVYRQRHPGASAVSRSISTSLPGDNSLFQPASSVGYPLEEPPPPVTARMQSSGRRAVPPDPASIPFDADLAEAMRQAQVSLFAIPRPPAEAEALS